VWKWNGCAARHAGRFPYPGPRGELDAPQISFTSDTLLGYQRFAMQQPGQYLLRLTYTMYPIRATRANRIRNWRGLLPRRGGRNALPLMLVEANPASTGCRWVWISSRSPDRRYEDYGYSPRPVVESGRILRDGLVRNVSTNPVQALTIQFLDFLADGLQFSDEDGTFFPAHP